MFSEEIDPNPSSFSIEFSSTFCLSDFCLRRFLDFFESSLSVVSKLLPVLVVVRGLSVETTKKKQIFYL